jgi:quinolinate synthase
VATSLQEQALLEEIIDLRDRRKAVILAHNYQIPQIQDIADCVGDSLALSQAASNTEAEVIVFCGVYFMAETAAILNPNKKVLIPDQGAGCSLVESSPTALRVQEWRLKHPNGAVVSYVNTTAEIKAESDYCCTSANAVEVVKAIPSDTDVLFIPDMFLGAYVEAMTGRKLDIWPGECHVHARIGPEEVTRLRSEYPQAEFLIHPECSCVSLYLYHLANNDISNDRSYILSTGGMMKHAKNSDANEFVVATETGILHGLRKAQPQKTFIPVREDAVCRYMKMITVENLHRSLRDMVYEVRVPEEISSRARVAIQRMLEIDGE